MPNIEVINKGKIYDRILANVIQKMRSGSALLLNNDGLRIAEKSCGLNNSDGIWGSANRLIDAGERVLSELHLDKAQFVNQVCESENFFLIAGRVNTDISYAILSAKVNKIPLGMLRLCAHTLKEQVKEVDSR